MAAADGWTLHHCLFAAWRKVTVAYAQQKGAHTVYRHCPVFLCWLLPQPLLVCPECRCQRMFHTDTPESYKHRSLKVRKCELQDEMRVLLIAKVFACCNGRNGMSGWRLAGCHQTMLPFPSQLNIQRLQQISSLML
ncbi:hypothetical protein GQ54DRAFT_34686 [Martensiomyces pterosporus]|nr:hypothetical protein GQ54DRAFT_34686 [Martensiomyces pterosporus]